MNAASEVWVYLSTTPLLHLTLTLAAFTLGQAVHERFGMTPLLMISPSSHHQLADEQREGIALHRVAEFAELVQR